MQKFPIVIIGAGPAGLMAAQQLAEAGEEVHIYDQQKAPARKFLVAGHGGFNLTHSEPVADLLLKYDKAQIQHIVSHFDNTQTVEWLKELGIETYVGSSGKIFPVKNIKPIQVLQAWLERLKYLNVQLHFEHQFIDFSIDQVLFQYNHTIKEVPYSKLILAMGGGSWKKTGSDAKWVSILTNKGITVKDLESANSGYNTRKDYSFLEGQVLKNIAVKFGEVSKKGEILFTQYGIEGSPIYYLNRFTRSHKLPLKLHIDLKPNLQKSTIIELLQTPIQITDTLKNKLKLPKAAISLLKSLDKDQFIQPGKLADAIKAFPIEVQSLRPLEEVISSAGGVDFNALNYSLALKKHPQVYCIGEMVDWEAPTGGYLLQACFSMGYFCAEQIIKNVNS